MTLLKRLEELKKENPTLAIEDEEYDSLYFGNARSVYNEPVCAPSAKIWKTFDEAFGSWKVIEEDVSDSGLVTLVIKK